MFKQAAFTSLLAPFLTGFIFSTFTVSANAGYLAVAESGEMIEKGIYAVSLLPQLRTSDGSGANIDVAIDTAYSDSMSIRIQAGAGKIDFHGGAALKYIPFPDVDNQPAMGAKFSIWYARVGSENFFTLQTAPLVSRNFQIQHGLLVPYIALPINISNGKDKTTTGLQITAGSEWRQTPWRNAIITGELAVSLSDSFSAITLGITFPLDDKKGFKR